MQSGCNAPREARSTQGIYQALREAGERSNEKNQTAAGSNPSLTINCVII